MSPSHQFLLIRQEYALQQIVSVDKLFANMALTDNGKALIKIAGGHCRTLENVQRVLENNPQEDRLPELLTLLGEEQKVSMTDLETAKPVLRSTISGIAVGLRRIIMVAGSSSYSADALRAYGYCSFLHSTKDYEMVIPALTPYQLVLYFSSLDAVLGEQFRDSFRSRKDQCNFGGIVFEKFHVAFECFRRMLFANEKLERLTSSSIRQFYGKDDACFSSDFDECSMSLHDKYIFEDVPQSKFTRHFVSSGFLTGRLFYTEDPQVNFIHFL